MLEVGRPVPGRQLDFADVGCVEPPSC